MNVKRALVLSPHTDDGELGCGGTIAKLIESGTHVCYVAFSICEESVPPEFPRDILASEVALATGRLGIKKENLTVYRYPVRNFCAHRQEILEKLVVLRRNFEPELVLMPSPDDIHQDHQVIHQEGLRAFKNTTVFGYEMPWNNVQFSNTAFIVLDERHITVKLAALAEYRSQQHRDYMKGNYIRALSITRGRQVQQSWAEAFQVTRCVFQ